MPKALDTILGHCIIRALLQAEGGIPEGMAKYGKGSAVSKWEAMRATVSVTPKAMRVATFIVLWAVGMKMEGREEYSITEYQRYWNENERQAYRVQNEFREIWPEFDTPNELARQIVKHVDARLARKEVAKLPMTLTVLA